jgi:hypothetical protein
MFHIDFHLSIGKETTVSPKNTADYLAASNERGRETDAHALAKRQARIERFSQLRTEINKLFNQHVEEYSADERIGKVFTLTVSETETHLGRIDRDGEVIVTSNSSNFTARFKSTTLVALDQTIEVKMNGQNPYLDEGAGRAERSATSERIVADLVDKAFRALR